VGLIKTTSNESRSIFYKERGKEGYQYNWAYGYMLMYLSQLSVVDEDSKKMVADLIPKLIDICVKAQLDNGGWTHGHEYVPEYEKDSYNDFVAVGLVILNGMGMAKQAGYDVPEDCIDKAIKYINASSGMRKGAMFVGYSPRSRHKAMRGIGRNAGGMATQCTITYFPP
jgi:hypothetical protein